MDLGNEWVSFLGTKGNQAHMQLPSALRACAPSGIQPSALLLFLISLAYLTMSSPFSRRVPEGSSSSRKGETSIEQLVWKCPIKNRIVPHRCSVYNHVCVCVFENMCVCVKSVLHSGAPFYESKSLLPLPKF